jgi:hypothetical protein
MDRGDPIECEQSHLSQTLPSASCSHVPSMPPQPMTTPHVTELPRRLEPTSLDTFLGDCAPMAVVLQLRARDGVAGRRPAHARRAVRALRPTGDPGPGGDAA